MGKEHLPPRSPADSCAAMAIHREAAQNGVMMEYKFTTANFEEEVLKSELPVLVDFYADWCGPCKMMAPAVEALAEEMNGKIKVGKCNIDDNLPVAQKYRVTSIPTFIVFKNGQPVSTFMGAMQAQALRDKVTQAIS